MAAECSNAKYLLNSAIVRLIMIIENIERCTRVKSRGPYIHMWMRDLFWRVRTGVVYPKYLERGFRKLITRKRFSCRCVDAVNAKIIALKEEEKLKSSPYFQHRFKHLLFFFF